MNLPRSHRIFGVAVTGLLLGGATSSARAEPMFLSRQYTRCTTCHYSSNGGGLLTPYRRSLSHQELSTWRGIESAAGAGSTQGQRGGEQEFLWGALGKTLGPVSLGVDLRPAHLSYDFDGTTAGKGRSCSFQDSTGERPRSKSAPAPRTSRSDWLPIRA